LREWLRIPYRHVQRDVPFLTDARIMVATRWKYWRISIWFAAAACAGFAPIAQGQERLPWSNPPSGAYGNSGDYRPQDGYPPREAAGSGDAYRPPSEVYVPPPPGASAQAYEGEPRYRPDPNYRPGESYDRGYGGPPPPRPYYGEPPPPPGAYDNYDRSTYSQSEILNAGHGFFGSVTKGLASVVEYTFQQAGRPNGYILGEDAGGAFVAGLRYGEGTLYTKDAGVHKVYWQGPSIGYDFGGEGSKTMVLVYNLRHPFEVYERFGGVQGSAYLVGGVGVQFLKNGHVTLAPIRAGVGLRFGANIGYLKYTRSPTWNPF
jgi:hypothetical protein